ncbi:hypothetical protein BLOT_007793 [Blomia tropicalis]|nr:hypothetical protein BLOT_007793 [Blomia tropicalis]
MVTSLKNIVRKCIFSKDRFHKKGTVQLTLLSLNSLFKNFYANVNFLIIAIKVPPLYEFY